MLRLHEWLIGNRFPNCRKIATELKVSTKTVQRDLNFMRDQMGLPIEYDKTSFGYPVRAPVTGFPAMGIIIRKPKATPWRELPHPGRPPSPHPGNRHRRRRPHSLRRRREFERRGDQFSGR